MMDSKELILGKWSLFKSNGNETGVADEIYAKNGTKESLTSIYKMSNEPEKISVLSSWRIEKNILVEKITSIDKKTSKMVGVKKGFELRSFIIELSTDVLKLKPLNTKHGEEATYYRSVSS